jgi:hypothetical protein
MQPIQNQILSPTAFQRSTPSSSEKSSDFERLKKSREYAGKVLNSYPDYAKATPGYTASIIEAFAQFDDGIQNQLSHISGGLRAKCKYLPTVADVIELGQSLQRDQAKTDDMERRFSGKRVMFSSLDGPRVNPALAFFPSLTKSLGQEADRLLRGVKFDVIYDAAKKQFFEGDEAARKFLNSEQKARL